jgi:hypothetical protein
VVAGGRAVTLCWRQCVFLSLLFATGVALADAPSSDAKVNEKPRFEVLWEWDAYYTSVGLHIPLNEEQLPDGGDMTEFEVYRHLFARSLKPGLFMLEASVYPMSALGVWVRKHEEQLYEDANIGGNRHFNAIQAVTAGFQEPWAVSAFVGSEMQFTKAGQDRRDTNRGYMGYLFSAGKKHIKDNVLIDDDWFEVEWKLKGERVFMDDRLAWSFRVGTKVNRNRDIADVIYLGINRSSLDFRGPFLSWLDNSNMRLLTEVSSDQFHLLRQEVIFGKKYPLPSWGVALELDFGVIYEKAQKYTGSLAYLAETSYSLVFRPNINF